MLEEIRYSKKALEQNILELIRLFETETTLSVSHVYINGATIMGKSTTIECEVEVEL